MNFKIRLISSQVISKKSFPVQTGSRFSAAIFSYHHFDQTWTYAIWISKIRLLLLKLWAKSLFPSKPDVDFQRQHFSVITSIKPEHMHLNFENPSIRSQDMIKKPFPVQTGSWFSATTFFFHHFYRTLSYTVWISKFCPIDLKLWAKNLFLKVIFDFSGQTGSSFPKQKVACPIPGKTLIYAV